MSLCCVLEQDTLLLQCLSLSKCINRGTGELLEQPGNSALGRKRVRRRGGGEVRIPSTRGRYHVMHSKPQETGRGGGREIIGTVSTRNKTVYLDGCC